MKNQKNQMNPYKEVNKMLEEIAEAYKAGNEKLAQEKAASLGDAIFPEEEASYYTDRIRKVFVASIHTIADDIQKKREEEKLEEFCEAVPEKESLLPAGVKGGIPCARKNDHQIYIDQRRGHSLIIGNNGLASEMLLFSMIDTISRAEQPDSFLLIDCNFKCAARMILPLQNRGYQCYKVTVTETGFRIVFMDGSEATVSQLCASLKDAPIAIFVKPLDFVEADNFSTSEFLTQIYTELAALASTMPKGELAQRVHIILDEFTNLPALDHMNTYMCTSLGRNISFTLIIQTLLQLVRQYGDKDSQTIIDNCRAIFFTGTPGINTAKDISRRLGEKEVGGYRPKFRPVMTPAELMRLKDGEMIWISGCQSIANIGERQMSFDYEYLNNVFPQSGDDK